ncbi:MAG TPA: Holliday junction resolvase RuvX [Actinomycetota bacterium]
MIAPIGIDLGTKRIGLAVATGSVATPHRVMQRSGDDAADAAVIAAEAAGRGTGRVVLGYPKRLDGTAGPAAQAAEEFAAALRDAGLDVVLWDERLSTAEVDKMLIGSGARRARRREVVDKLAATVILQNYLDAHPREEPGETG